MEKVEEESTETKKVERKKPAPKVGYRIDDTSWRIIKNTYLFIKSRKKWRDQGELKHKKLTAEATGISLACIYKLKLEQQDPPKRELKERTKYITGVSDEVKAEICKILEKEKDHITLNMLQEKLKEADLYSGSATSLGGIVRKLGYKYDKINHTWISANSKKPRKNKKQKKKSSPKEI